ncbi:MAG: cation:proton antiporter, partial [Christensenellaceae bacterium]|nr:cation:proton antiporter [Christensenellaceae bacterium]
NAYLSVYIMGIVLGNAHFNNYTSLSHYFDGINSLCEILIFFLIGLLSTPSEIVSILRQALMVAVFITFVSRPVSVFGLMSIFPGRNLRQMMLVSWAGLRGASSCVFAIMAVSMCTEATSDLFHIVFIVSLLSVSIQGALLPPISKALKMDENPTEEQ